MARSSSVGLGRVSALFAEQQRRGRTPGGVMVARQRGEIVLAEAVGLARGSRAPADAGSGTAAPAPVPMTVDTTFQVMSASKAVVAFAVAVLEDRGLLEVAAPVATVWPAFAAGGKGDITLLDVLTHRSGLVLEDLVRDRERWRDWADRVLRHAPPRRSARLRAAPHSARGAAPVPHTRDISARPHHRRLGDSRPRFRNRMGAPSPFWLVALRSLLRHPGGFGMLAFADPDADVSVAILTTANRGVSDLVRRFAPLAQAIRRAVSANKRQVVE
jgi:CubicO group peptidase (beta-lactamase class C family)